MTKPLLSIGEQLVAAIGNRRVSLDGWDEAFAYCFRWPNIRERIAGIAAQSADGKVTLMDMPKLGYDDADLEVIASRLIRLFPALDSQARHWLADTAGAALPVFEKLRPGDRRVRDAVAVARTAASGKASEGELKAHREAASDASRGFGGGPAHFAALAAKSALSKPKQPYLVSMQLCSLNAARALAVGDTAAVEREEARFLVALAKRLKAGAGEGN